MEVEPGVFVTGDEAALRQLTAILVDNAVKYANAGGEVTVCLRGGRHPVLTVENDCRNVDELPLQRLFDRFYRFDSARTGDGAMAWGFPSPAPSPKPTAPPCAPKRRGKDGSACACACERRAHGKAPWRNFPPWGFTNLWSAGFFSRAQSA